MYERKKFLVFDEEETAKEKVDALESQMRKHAIEDGSSSSSPEKLVLTSCDGEEFEVDLAVAIQSKMLKNMIEDNYATIPLANVTGKVLSKIIEYCKVHSEFDKGKIEEVIFPEIEPFKHDADPDLRTLLRPITPKKDERPAEEIQKIKEFDAEFVNLDTDSMFHLISAANYLNIKSLVDLICKRVVKMMEGKTPKEIREIFNIKQTFDPEEYQELLKQHSWVFNKRSW